MLHVTAPKLHAVIRSMYKEGLFLVSDVQQKKETSKGIWQTQYGFPMIVALCFRINSYGAVRFRDTIIKRLYGAKEKGSVIILQLNGGTNAINWMSSCRWLNAVVLSRRSTEALVWSSLFDGDSPKQLKGRTNPLIFVDLLNIQKVVLNIKYLRLYILSTNISTKEREWWKEKSSMFMPMFLFCPVKCCVETFVENLLIS